MMVIIRWFITIAARTMNPRWRKRANKFNLNLDRKERSERHYGRPAKNAESPRWICTR